MAQILDGLTLSKTIKTEIKDEVKKILSRKRRAPHLVAILVGNNGASKAYVNSKVKDCEEVGFRSSLVKFPSTVSEAELLEKIEELSKSKAVDGFIVQLPLPKQIDQEKSSWQLIREKMWMVFILKISEKWHWKWIRFYRQHLSEF